MTRNRFVVSAAIAASIAVASCKADPEQAAIDAGMHGASGSGGKAVSSGGAGGSSGHAGGSGGHSGASGSGGTGGRAGASGSGGHSGGSGGVGSGGDTALTDAGASTASCASTKYILCEDFEATAVGGIPSGWTKQGDPVSVADDEAHGGTHALKSGPKTDWERRISHDATALGGAHWGRIYYKVKLPVPDEFVHSTMVAFSGDGPTRGPGEYRVVDTVKAAADAQGIESKHQFLYNVQPEGDEFGTGTDYNWKFDGAWHCAEWHIDASKQAYEFFLDGSPVLSFEHGAGNYEGSDIPPTFDQVKVGWNNYQKVALPGFTAWFDDVAFDDERIGCE